MTYEQMVGSVITRLRQEISNEPRRLKRMMKKSFLHRLNIERLTRKKRDIIERKLRQKGIQVTCNVNEKHWSEVPMKTMLTFSRAVSGSGNTARSKSSQATGGEEDGGFEGNVEGNLSWLKRWDSWRRVCRGRGLRLFVDPRRRKIPTSQLFLDWRAETDEDCFGTRNWRCKRWMSTSADALQVMTLPD